MPLVSKKGLIDPISLIGVSLFLVSLIVGVNVVVNHGSFDIRNWAKPIEEFNNPGAGPDNGNAALQQDIKQAQKEAKSNNKKSTPKPTPKTTTKTTTTNPTVSPNSFGYQPTTAEIANGPSYYKSATGNDGLGFVSGTYLDSQGNRHVTNLPETQQAYQNWVASKTGEVQSSSLDELAKKYNIADINTPEGETQLLNKMVLLDTNTRNNAISILNQKAPTNPVAVQPNTTINKQEMAIKANNNQEIYNKYVNTSIPDQTLAQEYCSDYKARYYASRMQCTGDFQREDYLILSSLSDADKLKAQGVYEENLTNDLMKTNADYNTKIVLMQIVTKFQNDSISDNTLAQDYCLDYSAWGYDSEQDCKNKFQRTDYLKIADQLQKNLTNNPNPVPPANGVVSVIKTANNFCLDILNTDCVNGCIPDTTGGKCKTTSSVAPVSPKTFGAGLASCAKATDGYCYDKNGEEIVFWSQRDYRWGSLQLPGPSNGNLDANTYAASACGQATLAMILASYTDPGITPVDVVKQYYPSSNYKGTGFSIASDVLTKKGYDVERLNVSTQKLEEYIENGWLGFTSITFKDGNGNAHSHFTLIVGVNNKGDFVYNDPYFGENTTLKDKGINYTIDDITLIKPPKK
ncbi:MAG: papain-like cysteine protease family protein [Candidatus Microgenomates bacterium]|jgi:hypothetical protein